MTSSSDRDLSDAVVAGAGRTRPWRGRRRNPKHRAARRPGGDGWLPRSPSDGERRARASREDEDLPPRPRRRGARGTRARTNCRIGASGRGRAAGIRDIPRSFAHDRERDVQAFRDRRRAKLVHHRELEASPELLGTPVARALELLPLDHVLDVRAEPGEGPADRLGANADQLIPAGRTVRVQWIAGPRGQGRVPRRKPGPDRGRPHRRRTANALRGLTVTDATGWMERTRPCSRDASRFTVLGPASPRVIGQVVGGDEPAGRGRRRVPHRARRPGGHPAQVAGFHERGVLHAARRARGHPPGDMVTPLESRGFFAQAASRWSAACSTGSDVRWTTHRPLGHHAAHAAHGDPPSPLTHLRIHELLATGVRAIDGLFTLGRRRASASWPAPA